MNDLFLKVDGVSNEEQALTWSINAALQRNKVYKADEDYGRREKFRARWAKLLSEEAQTYRNPERPVPDEYHCDVIARIADTLSSEFGEILAEGRLRFGTSQKAFNLYLKYLWALNEAQMPPHCPIDSVVLNRANINGSWTKCDSREEYMTWINQIRKRLSLAEWENEVWLRWGSAILDSETYSAHLRDSAPYLTTSQIYWTGCAAIASKASTARCFASNRTWL